MKRDPKFAPAATETVKKRDDIESRHANPKTEQGMTRKLTAFLDASKRLY